MKILNNGLVMADLDNVIEATVKRKLNSEFTLTIKAFEKQLKSEYFNTENVIEVDGVLFDITYIQTIHEADVIYQLECEHISYRLLNKTYVGGYSLTGTPQQILSNLLDGTDLNVGEVTSGVSMTISTTEDSNAYGLMLSLASVLGWELDFDGYKIDLKDEIGIDNGFEVAFGKNLKSITKHVDKRSGEIVTSYEVDILELKESEEYSKKNYGVLEIINLGDSILINDEVIGLSIKQKILSIEYDALKKRNTKIEIANTIEFIADSITSIKNDVRVNSASIEVANGQIELLTSDVEGNYSLIQQNASQILLKASQDSIDDLGERVDSAELVITPTAIVSTVRSSTDYSNDLGDKANKSTIVSEINQTSESIKISANKLELNGLVEISDLTNGTTTISGDNIRTGTISASRISTNISQVNSSLNIGSLSDTGNKEIVFSGVSLITSTYKNGLNAIVISAPYLELGSTVDINGSLKINNDYVATEDWVNGRAYLTQSSANSKYVRPYNSSYLCYIDATSTGIAIRDSSGNSLGNISYD